MKKNFLLLIISGMLVLISNAQNNAPCTANWWAYCCKCAKCFVVTALPAFGHCRECNLLCADCRKELGDLEKALEKLKAKNRGLNGIYQGYNNSLIKADKAYYDAWMRITGEGSGGFEHVEGINGSLGNFSTALLGFASDFSGKTGSPNQWFNKKWVAKSMTVASDGIGIYQTATGSGGNYTYSTDPADAVTNYGGIATDVFTFAEVQDFLGRDLVKRAVNTMFNESRNGVPIDKVIENFNRNCDLIPNTPIALNNLALGAEGFGVLADWWALYKASDALFNDITDVISNWRESRAASKELEKILAEILKNNDLMECIKETIDSLNAGGLKSAHNTVIYNSYAISVILPAAARVELAKSFFTSDKKIDSGIRLYDTTLQINELKLESALTKLKQLKELLKNMLNRFEKEILPPLMPWLTNRWKELKPAMLMKILQKAKTSLNTAINDMNRMLDLNKSIEEDLQTAVTGYEIDYITSNINAGGSVISNNENRGWSMLRNDKIKGELGRVNMNFPTTVDWSFDIYTTEDKFVTNRSSYSKHPGFYDIAPGNYIFKLNSVPVENVPVEKGKEVRLNAGALNVITHEHWELYDESKKKFYTSNNKPVKLALPIGNYTLNFEGKDYQVTVKDRMIVKFEKKLSELFDQ